MEGRGGGEAQGIYDQKRISYGMPFGRWGDGGFRTQNFPNFRNIDLAGLQSEFPSCRQSLKIDAAASSSQSTPNFLSDQVAR
jgi:hypothetical protein